MSRHNLKKQIRLLLFSASALSVLTACPPKNKPRIEHEGAKQWQAEVTPDDRGVGREEFDSYNLRAAYELLKGDPNSLTEKVLKPLSRFLLNGKFIEDPRFHGTRMAQMIEIFNTAFLNRMEKGDTTKDFQEIEAKYYQTLFAGCSRDLKKDCYNAELFSRDTRHTRILTLMARKLDADLEARLNSNEKSAPKCIQNDESCRDLVESRYRILAMGLFKRNRYDDKDFAFAYLKYARMFALLTEHWKTNGIKEGQNLASSYLTETHTKIFETIIPKYKPKNPNDEDFKKFVTNFNPWTHSNRSADMFQHGTRIMFKFGATCCLYEDANGTKVTAAVKEAIDDTQKSNDNFAVPQFRQMIKEIQTESLGRLFHNLGLAQEIREIELPNSHFYDEFFLIVDRLFRGHLTTEEVEMVLANANPSRVETELPRRISTYIRVNLAYMILKTNRYMAGIYSSDLTSDEIFRGAITRSRALTSDWHAIQAQIVTLDRMMGNYFKGRRIGNRKLFDETSSLILGVNRNIHYISVYPNMIMLTYFLADKKGKLTINSWWGTFEIDADTILGAMFDGRTENPWFVFGKDPEPLNRQTLLYGFDYLLATDGLKSFVAKNGSKFFDMIFTQYLGNSLAKARQDLADYERSTVGKYQAAGMSEVCNYELGKSKRPPHMEIGFLDLNKFTYAGLGDQGVRGVLMSSLAASRSTVGELTGLLENRILFSQVLKDVIESDLRRRGERPKEGQVHDDIKKIESILAEFNGLKRRLSEVYLTRHKDLARCASILQEVERRRANRLYEEERAHLGRIFDMMKEKLSGITDPTQLEAAGEALNKTYFRDPKNGYRFDKVDGMTYKMSQFDLYSRIKSHIEADIFTSPSKAMSVVGKETVNEAEYYNRYRYSWQDYARPRDVSVYIPEGLKDNDIVSRGTATSIYFRDDREDFIRQGMAAFNGKSGAFIDWWSQMSSGVRPKQYVETLLEFYFLSPAKDKSGAPSPLLSKEELVEAYVESMASQMMDDLDVRNAQDFGVEGLYGKAGYADVLFEKDFRTQLPFFYSLMRQALGTAHLLEKNGVVGEAIQFAVEMNSLKRLKSFMFPQNPDVESSVKRIYGERVEFARRQVDEVFNFLQTMKKDKDGRLVDATKEGKVVESAADLDPRLTLTLYLDGQTPVPWYVQGWPNLVHKTSLDDLKTAVKQFDRDTDRFYSFQVKAKGR
ncbi:MAG: hypothetical protein AB7F86_19670 [Bdellovibrionales bacterium]